MVAFCEQCGVSLPGADTVIRNGREYATPQTTCPHCGQLACLSPEEPITPADELLPDQYDTIIKDGKVVQKPKEEELGNRS